MIHLLKFYINKSYSIDLYTPMNDIMTYVSKDYISIDDLYEADVESNIYVLALNIMSFKDTLVINRMLAIRRLHKCIDDIHSCEFNSFYIFDINVVKSDKFKILNILSSPITRYYAPRNNVDFLSLVMNEENIITYCRANPTKPLWALFYESLTHCRNRVKDLPSDSRIWISSNDDHFMVVRFLNMIVRGNRDYICQATNVGNVRIEGLERIPIFRPAIDALHILLAMSSNLF